jgi:hypothetical protein
MLSGTILCGIIVLSLLNLSSRLSIDEAEERVRLLLSKEIAQGYVGVQKMQEEKNLSAEMGMQLGEALTQIKEIEFASIEINKLIPDILLRPHRPTHIVRVELRTRDYQYPPRYFWLSWTHIDRETSKYAWYFSL